MNNFSLTELPDELVNEILTRAQPEDIARIFATDATHRIVMEDRAEKASIVEEAKMAAAQTDLSIFKKGGAMAPIAVSGELANLLGNSFPKYQDETIVTRNMLTEWFALYLNLNNLLLPGGTHFAVDKNLADLSGTLNWVEGSTMPFSSIQKLKAINSRAIATAIPDDVLRHLAFVKDFMAISFKRISEKKLGAEMERHKMKRQGITVPTATLLAEQQKKQQYLDMMKRTRLLSPRGY